MLNLLKNNQKRRKSVVDEEKMLELTIEDTPNYESEYKPPRKHKFMDIADEVIMS